MAFHVSGPEIMIEYLLETVREGSILIMLRNSNIIGVRVRSEGIHFGIIHMYM